VINEYDDDIDERPQRRRVLLRASCFLRACAARKWMPNGSSRRVHWSSAGALIYLWNRAADNINPLDNLSNLLAPAPTGVTITGPAITGADPGLGNRLETASATIRDGDGRTSARRCDFFSATA